MSELIEKQVEQIKWVTGLPVVRETIQPNSDTICSATQFPLDEEQTDAELKHAFHQTCTNLRELQKIGVQSMDAYVQYNNCIYLLPVNGNRTMQIKGPLAKEVKRLIHSKLP